MALQQLPGPTLQDGDVQLLTVRFDVDAFVVDELDGELTTMANVSNSPNQERFPEKYSMTASEAQAKYNSEWPALNAAKERAISAGDKEAEKKARRQLSWLSNTCIARIHTAPCVDAEPSNSDPVGGTLLDSLETRMVAANKLGRIKPEAMSEHELDLAAALVLRLDITVVSEDVPPLVRLTSDSEWLSFSPTNVAADLLHVISNVEVVVSSRKRYDEKSDHNKVTGFRHGAHAFYSGTTFNSNSLPEAVCRSLAALLEQDIKYSTAWGNA